MKRERCLIEPIASPDNLRLAFWKAARGKTGRPEVERFRKSLDKSLMGLREEILEGKVSVGCYTYFTIYDPKERKICAAAFRERVLHHALMNICHASFESYQLFDSYACRLHKGTYAALDRAKVFQRKYRWFLKLDVRKYFDSIPHEMLKRQLARRFKEERLLRIFGDIVDSYESSSGKGIPVGNLTSQYFANHYLAYADHYLKETLQASAYVRYMDDMVIWANDKAQLMEAGRKFQAYISETLLLTLKPFCLNSVGKGLPFLGYTLFPSTVKLRHGSKVRFEAKLRHYGYKLSSGEWTQQEYQQHILPLIAFTRYANAAELRQRLLKKGY